MHTARVDEGSNTFQATLVLDTADLEIVPRNAKKTRSPTGFFEILKVSMIFLKSDAETSKYVIQLCTISTIFESRKFPNLFTKCFWKPLRMYVQKKGNVLKIIM